MSTVLTVHYDEIGIKGRNRYLFEKSLRRSLKEAARAVGSCQVRHHASRFLVFPAPETDGRTLARALAPLPGVRYVLLGESCADNLAAIESMLRQQLPTQGVASFGVRVRRRDKRFPLKSAELAARLGTLVQKLRPWRVDLTRPDLWIRVDLPGGLAVVSAERLEGPGGLPSGSSGRAIALLSGGIDSPVAAHMMMTRGLRLTLLHFHSAPFTSRASQEKVRDLAALLCRHQPRLSLIMLPFADPIQQAIVTSTLPAFRVVLYRRFMLRVALKAAEEVGAGCLVTGEVVGQVASQTIQNLRAVEALCPLPVLRPLVGMGKSQIVERAEALGTFEISIRPHDDCCTYLMPKTPVTRSTPEELDAVEAALPVDELVEAAWASRTCEIFSLRDQARGLPPRVLPGSVGSAHGNQSC